MFNLHKRNLFRIKLLLKLPHMNLFHALTLFVSIFSACTSVNKDIYPTIILDDKFNQIQKADSKIIPSNYELNSLKGFVVDCSNYDFTLIKSMNENKLPDQLHIISKSGTFTVKLNPTGKTIIDNSTMQSLDDPKINFESFISGDTALLGIGTLKNNEMMTYWLGRAVVK